MACDTDLLRPRLTRRKASFTVSLIVSVPSCAFAAPRGPSSISPGCFAILCSIYERTCVYTVVARTATFQRDGRNDLAAGIAQIAGDGSAVPGARLWLSCWLLPKQRLAGMDGNRTRPGRLAAPRKRF